MLIAMLMGIKTWNISRISFDRRRPRVWVSPQAHSLHHWREIAVHISMLS